MGTEKQAEESEMKDDVGGCSQDEDGSDFINGDDREQLNANKPHRLKKGANASEEEDFVDKSHYSVEKGANLKL